MIDRQVITVKILNNDEKWMGMTYKEDMLIVKEYLLNLINDGLYPNFK